MALISTIPSQTSGDGGGNPHASWFGTGEDGDLIVSTDVALPVALDSGQIIKQYNSLTVTSSGILHPANRCNGMILLVKGDLTVDGTIHVDKCAPLVNDSEELAAQEQHVALCGELTGGKGGNGGNAYESAPGSAASPGGSGGPGFQFGGGFGGGGGGVGANFAGAGGSSNPRPPAGTIIPYPSSTTGNSEYGAGGSARQSSSSVLARGGAGPGGGGGQGAGAHSGDAGDAIGGGALWIFAQGKVRIGGTAKISATGGDGGDAYGYAASGTILEFGGGGGSGGGGIVCIVHTGDIVNAGAVTASPGTAGINKTNSAYAAGQSGESGTVLITNISDLLATRVQQAFTALNILGVKT